MSIKRSYKILIGLGLLPVVLILGGLAYLKFADLGGYSDNVERILSDLLGRRVSIAGRFEPKIGRISSIVIEQITLDNPDWSASPAMVQIDHLEGTIDLWSLVSGPIHVRDVRINGVTVQLEVDAEGRASWDFEFEPQPAATDEPAAPFPELTLDDVQLNEVHLTYTSPDRERPLEVDVERLDLHTTDDAMIVLGLKGLFERRPLTLDGNFGPLDRLVEGGEIKHALTVGLGDIALRMDGRIGDLSTLDDVTWDLDLRGPEIERVAEWLAAPSPGQGPFSVVGKVSSSPEGIDLALDADLGEVTARVNGRVDSFSDPQQVDVVIEAACDDLKTVGSWFGEKRLPAEPLRLGGKLGRVESRFALEEFDVRLGEATFLIDGLLGDPPGMSGTDVTIDARGSDLSVFSEIADTSLPAEAYRAKGRLVFDDRGLSFDRFSASLGKTEVDLSGVLGVTSDLLGTSLDVRLRAPDPTTIAKLSGRDDLPSGPYAARGRIAVKRDRYDVKAFNAAIGDLEIEVDGAISRDPDFVGSDAQVRLAGQDLAEWGSRFGVEDLPAGSFEVVGRVAVMAGAYRLSDVVVQAAGIEAELSGQVGADPIRQGSDLTFRVQVDDLQSLEALPEVPPLPAGSLSVAGRARSDDGAVRVDDLEISLDENRLHADGTLGPFPELNRTDLQVSLSGPDLAAAAKLVPDGVPPDKTLPAESFAVSGQFRVFSDEYELGDVTVRVGEFVLHADGRIGAPPELHGTDLTFDADGPDSSWLATLAGVDLPAGIIRAKGRVEWLEAGAKAHDVRVELGPSHFEADGAIGLPPKWIGTDLSIRAEGPSLAEALAFTEKPGLPDRPFRVAGKFEGTPEEFTGKQIELRLGDSDLSGSIRADLREKPRIEARFTSQKIDLTNFVGDRKESAAPESPEPPEDDDRLIIPDDPIDLQFLDEYDIDLVWDLGRLQAEKRDMTDVRIVLDLQDGHLRLGPVRAGNDRGETISADLTLAPFEGGHRYKVELIGKDWHLNLMGSGIERELRPPFHIDARLAGQGRSVREMTRSAEGRIVVKLSQGRIDSGAAGLVGADVLMELISHLNPFSKTEPYSEVECMVLAIRFHEGTAKLEPVALRSTKLTVVGRGAVDLETEHLHFEWTMKPRKGVGLSASTITNPYISLGGTLADPNISLKPIDSVTATTAAVATAGLSLLGRGLWNRATAGKKVCKKALEQIAKDDAISAASPSPAPSQ